MNPSAVDIQRYSCRKLDRFFLDTNIWLLMYGPLPMRDWRTDVYNAALRDMKKHGCEIWVDVLVFSEFINVFVQKEYGRICGKLPDERASGFKAIRNSSQFRQVAQEVAAAARTILKVATRCATGFEAADIRAVLGAFETCRLDFNDQMLVELCKANGLALATHDADFKSASIPILTANRQLLA